MSRRELIRMSPEEVDHFLEGHRVVTVATVAGGQSAIEFRVASVASWDHSRLGGVY